MTEPTTTSPGSPQDCVEPSKPPMTRMRFLSQVWKLAGPYWNCERKAKVRGATLYVWPLPPCHRCACDIVQAGIKRVVVPLEVAADLRERWRDALALSCDLFAEAGIHLVGIPDA